MPNGQQAPEGLFEIPVVDAQTGETLKIFSPTDEPLSDADFDALLQEQAPEMAREVAEAAPGVAKDIAQRAAAPAFLSTALPFLARGVPGAAGLAARGALAAGGGMLGLTGVTMATENRLPTRNEYAFEGLGSMAPELATSLIVDPSDTWRLAQSLLGKGTKLEPGTQVTRAAFGELFKKELPELFTRVFKEENRVFDAMRRSADAINLRAPLSDGTMQMADDVLRLIDQANLTPAEATTAKRAINDLLTRATEGNALGGARPFADVPFSAISEARLKLNRVLPEFHAKDLSPADRALRDLDNALKREMRGQAAGTPIAQVLEDANNALKFDFRPARIALRAVGSDSAAIEDVMQILVRKPSRLAAVMKRVDEPLAVKLRTAYFSDLLLEGASDSTGIINAGQVANTWRKLPKETKAILSGGRPGEVDDIFKRMESIVLSEKGQAAIKGTMAAAGTGAVTAGLMGELLRGEDTDMSDLVPAFLATVSGAIIIGKIIATPGARTFWQRGLSTPGRAGFRFGAQAIAQAGMAALLGPPSAQTMPAEQPEPELFGSTGQEVPAPLGGRGILETIRGGTFR